MKKLLFIILTICNFNYTQSAYNVEQHDDLIEVPMCMICRDDMIPIHNITITPCAHTFHTECINAWISFHNTCPLCRTRVREDQPEYINAEDDLSPFQTHYHNSIAIINNEIVIIAIVSFRFGNRRIRRYGEIRTSYTQGAFVRICDQLRLLIQQCPNNTENDVINEINRQIINEFKIIIDNNSEILLSVDDNIITSLRDIILKYSLPIAGLSIAAISYIIANNFEFIESPFGNHTA